MMLVMMLVMIAGTTMGLALHFSAFHIHLGLVFWCAMQAARLERSRLAHMEAEHQQQQQEEEPMQPAPAPATTTGLSQAQSQLAAAAAPATGLKRRRGGSTTGLDGGVDSSDTNSVGSSGG